MLRRGAGAFNIPFVPREARLCSRREVPGFFLCLMVICPLSGETLRPLVSLLGPRTGFGSLKSGIRDLVCACAARHGKDRGPCHSTHCLLLFA
jgi:hypothetical protein